jgi:hypothetical protein
MNFCRGGTACRHGAPQKIMRIIVRPFHWSEIVVVKNSTRADDWRKQAWLLKKSIFLKPAKISGIENAYPKCERRL